MNIGCEKCHSNQELYCLLQSEEVFSNRTIQIFKKGQYIFKEGLSSNGIFLVNSGKIKMTKLSPDGKESIVHIVSAGDLMGHHHLFSNEKYYTSAVALEECHVSFIDKNIIFKALKDYPTLALEIIKSLSHSMCSFEIKTASIMQRNVRERLAELIFNLGKSFGIKKDNRIQLDIKLTREEFASMIGTVNETVIRFITEFKEEGLIQEEGKTLYIINEQKLMEFANLDKKSLLRPKVKELTV